VTRSYHVALKGRLHLTRPVQFDGGLRPPWRW
jgi:hypothetical protein